MSEVKIGLDNPIFAGRFKEFGRGSYTPKLEKKVYAPQTITEIVATPQVDQVSTADNTNIYVEKPARASITQPVKPPVVRLSHSEVIQRNITSKPRTVKYRKPFLSMQRVAFSMATLVFLAGIGTAVIGFKTNKEVKAQVQAVSKRADVPGEDKPSDSALANYKVNPDEPRIITISKFNIKSRIFRQGLDAKGALKAPGNVHDIGWYKDSSKPGKNGAMLFDGHVHGPTVKGAFYQLKNLSEGDEIQVERGDGQVFTYSVVTSETKSVNDTDMRKAMLPIDQKKPGLNLITCTGKLDTKTNEYPERIVIYAVQK